MNDSLDLDDTEQLKDAIEELKIQNYQLKSNLADSELKLQESLQNYSKLKSEFNIMCMKSDIESKGKIEELERRIQILIQTNAELKTNFDQNRQQNNQSLISEIDRLQQQHNAEREELEQRIEKLENQNNSLQETITKERNNATAQNAVISRLVRQSEQYFGQNISTMENLIKMFSQPRIQPPKASQIKEIAELKQIIITHESTIKDLTKQIHNLQVVNRSKEEENDSIKKYYESIILSQQQKSSSRIKQLEAQISTQQIEFEATQERNKIPDAPVKRFRTALVQTEEEKNSFVPIEEHKELENEIVAKNKEILALNSKIADQTQKIKQLETERVLVQKDANEICNKVEAKYKNFQVVQNQLSEAQVNLEFEKRKQADLTLKITDLNSKLESSKCENELANKKLKSLQDFIEQINKSVEDRDKEINQLCDIRDHLLEIIAKQGMVLDTHALTIEKLSKKAKETKMQTVLVPEKAEEINFDFEGFPADLSQLLSNIADNDGFSMNQRVKGVLQIISKWINKTLNQMKIHETNSSKEINELKKQYNNFVNTLRKSIGDDKIKEEEIPRFIENLLLDSLTLRESKGQADQKVNDLLQTLDQVSLEHLYETFNDQRETIEELQASLEQEKQQRLADENYFKERMRQSKSKRDNLEGTIACLEEANEEARAQIESQNMIIEDLQKQNQEIVETLRKKEEIEGETEEEKDIFDECMNSQTIQYHAMRENLTKEVEVLTKEKHELELELATTINELQLSESRLSKAKEDYETLLNKYNDTCNVLRKSEAAIKSEMQKNIDDMKAKYEKIQEILEEQSNKANNVAKDLSDKLNQSEKQIGTLKAQLSDMQMKLNKEEANKKVLTESFERSKKLIEAQTKARIVIAETNSKLVIDEVRQEHDRKIMNIYGYIAENFGTLFDASQQLNEESFHNLISIIKKELEKSRKQDIAIRKFLNAKDFQTTDEAMTSYIIANHPILKN